MGSNSPRSIISSYCLTVILTDVLNAHLGSLRGMDIGRGTDGDHGHRQEGPRVEHPPGVFEGDPVEEVEFLVYGKVFSAIGPVEAKRGEASHRSLGAEHGSCQDLVLRLSKFLLRDPF